MRTPTALLKWLLPAAFCFPGLWLYFFVAGHGFLGIILCGIAAVITCYYLLSRLKQQKQTAAKILQRTLSAALAIGLLLYALTLIPITRAAAGSGANNCSYLVVLGAKVNGTAPSRNLRDRIHAAYRYLSEHPDTVAVLSGGQGDDEDISEAQCMFNELVALGIDPRRLWLEEKSTSTRENLIFSLALIEEKTGSRPDRLGILSNEFHLYRAGNVAAQCGVDAVLIPAKTSRLTLKLNYYLREVAAIWYYTLLGG